MDDKRDLTGWTWHVGYLKMDENDTRRDKRRCIHFLRNESHRNYCQKNFTNCIGSSHCPFYKEIQEGSEERSVKTKSAKIKELLRKIFEEK